MKKKHKKRSVFSDRSGAGYIKTAIVVLVLAAVFAVVFSYAEKLNQLKDIETAVETTLDGALLKRSVESFASTNDGSRTDFVFDADTFLSLLGCDEDKVEKENGYYAVYGDGGEILLKISEPVVSIEDDGEPYLAADFDVYLPLGFGDLVSDGIKVTMHTRSSLVFTG